MVGPVRQRKSGRTKGAFERSSRSVQVSTNEILVGREDESSSTTSGSIPQRQIDVFQQAVIPYRIGLNEISGLIPEFRPGFIGSLTASEWIDKLENLRSVYGWDERTMLLYATLRLKDAAQYWSQGRQIPNHTWEKFKCDLLVGFPSGLDAATVHAKLMARKRKANEPIETYVYEIVSLAKRAKLDDQCTTKYIISGLGDQKLMTVLTASGSDTPVELLTQIKRYESIVDQEKARNAVDHQRSRPLENWSRQRYVSENASRNRSFSKTPYNRKVNQNFVGNCFKCGKQGHKANRCIQGVDKTKRVHMVSRSNRELYQIAEVDGIPIEAFVDLGSD